MLTYVACPTLIGHHFRVGAAKAPHLRLLSRERSKQPKNWCTPPKEWIPKRCPRGGLIPVQGRPTFPMRSPLALSYYEQGAAKPSWRNGIPLRKKNVQRAIEKPRRQTNAKGRRKRTQHGIPRLSSPKNAQQTLPFADELLQHCTTVASNSRAQHVSAPTASNNELATLLLRVFFLTPATPSASPKLKLSLITQTEPALRRPAPASSPPFLTGNTTRGSVYQPQKHRRAIHDTTYSHTRGEH